MCKRGIAFTGPYSDINFGDYGMLVNNIYDLNVRNITLFSYDNEFLNKINHDYLGEYTTNIVEVQIKNNVYHHISRDSYTSTPLELLECIENYDEICSEINNIELLIVNGGGYFNELWSKPHRITRLLKIIAPILIARQLNKPVFLTGNSFGPFGQDTDFFASIFGRLTDTIFRCRDNLYSPQWLRKIGIESSKIDYIPDDLLLINQKITDMKTKYRPKTSNYIVMENYLPLDYLKNNMDKIIEFSNSIHERYGLSIVFMPFHLENGGMNQAKLLDKYINHYEYIDLDNQGYLPLQDAINVLANAKMVISSRYHALVVAMGTRTPTISVLRDVVNDKRYYYNKNMGVLQEVLRGIPFDERLYLGTDYIETLDNIKNNYTEIRKRQLDNYNQQFEYNMDRLSSIRTSFLNKVQQLLKG